MIRIENPKVCKFVAEHILEFSKKHGEEVVDDIEDNHVFVGWKLWKLFVCINHDFGQNSIVAYMNDLPDSKWDDLFFVSYHYPKFDDELGGGLLTLGKSRNYGWDYGGGVDDPKY